MRSFTLSEFAVSVLSRGTSFEGGFRLFDREQALEAVTEFEQAGFPILGGDVYEREGASIVPAYCNWSTDRNPGEFRLDYVARAALESRTYIQQFTHVAGKEPLFDLVPGGCHVQANPVLDQLKDYWEQRYSRERFAQHKSLRSIALDCRCIITDDEFHTTLKDMLGLPEEYYARHTGPVAMWNGLTKSLDRPTEIILLNSHVLLENLVDGPLVLDVLRTASAEGYIKLSER